MPLPTTFAGVSARGEGLFRRLSNAVVYNNLWFYGINGIYGQSGYTIPDATNVSPASNNFTSQPSGLWQMCIDSLGRICMPIVSDSLGTVEFATGLTTKTTLHLGNTISGGCVLGPDNNVYVSMLSNVGGGEMVATISPSLTVTSYYVTGYSGAGAQSLCTDGISKIFCFSRGAIGYYNVSSIGTATYLPTVTATGGYGEAILYGPDNNIYVTTTYYSGTRTARKSVWYFYQITLSGTVTSYTISDFGGGDRSGGNALAVGPDGNIYISGSSTSSQYAAAAKYNISTGSITTATSTYSGRPFTTISLAPNGYFYMPISNDPYYVKMSTSLTFTMYDTSAFSSILFLNMIMGP